MAKTLKVACIQMNSGPVIDDNLKDAEALIRDAAGQGASLISTPEVTDQVLSNRLEKLDQALCEDTHPGLPKFAALAEELGVFLHIGSICVKVAEEKITNRGYVFSPQGKIAARYDKIHLYDADLPSGESHRESRIFIRGNQAVTLDVGQAKLGLSICYDVRFPHLFRDLVKQGADVLAVPAAFTVPSGIAHWEVLLRARAIENAAFVIAAAQSGDHQGARETYGHSMIIGPWGDVLAEAGTDVGVITAELDLEDSQKARQAIPALQHDQDYSI